MRNTSLILLVISLAMAGAAAALAHNWLQSRQPLTGTVVVATRSLSFGAELNNDNLTTIEWAADKLPAGAFTTTEGMLKGGNRYVLTPIASGEPVLASKITEPGQRGSLSALLDGDMRAVAVRVDDIRGVAGFILPGDRVDVVLIRTSGTEGDRSYADVIVQNVKVLAVDQQANERPDKANVVAKAVTLAVNSDDAQKILLASNIGKLSLTLRQPGRKGQESTRRISEGDLTASASQPASPLKQPQDAPVASVQPVSRDATVFVIHGMKSEQYSVSQDSEQ